MKKKVTNVQFAEYNASVMDFVLKSMSIYSFSYMLRMMPPKEQRDILDDVLKSALEKTKILYGEVKFRKEYEESFKQEFYRLFGIEYKGK